MTTVLIIGDDEGCRELARDLASADAKINVVTIGKVDREACVCVTMTEQPVEEQDSFYQTRNKIESFSEWYKALIEEDKSLWLKDVKRPPGELRKMYRRYKEHNLKRGKR